LHQGIIKLSTFDQLSALATTYHFCQPSQPCGKEIMENFAELMQRLLEIQSGGRQRSPELIEEDARLMDRLQKRTLRGKPTHLRGKPTQTMQPSQDTRVDAIQGQSFSPMK
jgi:hypothetical protein